MITYLPVLIGWFSLNVPSALGIYWLANNLSTTATSFAIKAYVSCCLGHHGCWYRCWWGLLALLLRLLEARCRVVVVAVVVFTLWFSSRHECVVNVAVFSESSSSLRPEQG